MKCAVELYASGSLDSYIVSVGAPSKAAAERLVKDDLLFRKCYYRIRPLSSVERARDEVEKELYELATPRREEAVLAALSDEPRSYGDIREAAVESSGLSFEHGNQILSILNRYAVRVGEGPEDRVGWVKK